MGEPSLFEGDILLRPDEKFATERGLILQPNEASFAASRKRRWTKGIVPYTFADSLSKQEPQKLILIGLRFHV